MVNKSLEPLDLMERRSSRLSTLIFTFPLDCSLHPLRHQVLHALHTSNTNRRQRNKWHHAPETQPVSARIRPITRMPRGIHNRGSCPGYTLPSGSLRSISSHRLNQRWDRRCRKSCCNRRRAHVSSVMRGYARIDNAVDTGSAKGAANCTCGKRETGGCGKEGMRGGELDTCDEECQRPRTADTCQSCEDELLGVPVWMDDGETNECDEGNCKSGDQW